MWGGETHEHEWTVEAVTPQSGGTGEASAKQVTNRGTQGGVQTAISRGFCPCGAWLGVLGLEPTLEMYVAHMVEVFRGVRRVLRSDGCVWLNLGDSYNAYNGGAGHGSKLSKNQTEQRPMLSTGFGLQNKSLKPKDRMMVPARVAIALQADGWWLRDEIVWHKPNPMPSSVTDRTTPAHEMVYLLTKSARYFYDAEAIREPNATVGDPREGNGRFVYLDGKRNGSDGLNEAFAVVNPAGRNKRSVWTIATAPYPDAHFATFPPKLIVPMILAGTSERGACPECGAPWARETVSGATTGRTAENGKGNGELGKGARFGDAHSETTGWHPTCKHAADPVPCTVLDIFGGSGTVGMVSRALGRRSVLIDLKSDYLGQMLKRATVEWDTHEPEPVVDVPAEGLWTS